MSAPVLSLVLPAYNEGDHLRTSLDVFKNHLDRLNTTWEIILVNDGSRDETWSIIREAATADPRIKGLSFSRNFGKEQAIRAGIERTSGHAVILMDSDLQHPPAIIGEMMRLWQDDGNKIVNAVKRHRGHETFLQKKFAEYFYALYSLLTGEDLRNQSDFKLLDRAVVDHYLSLEERNLFFRGMIPWMGFKRASISFEVQDRACGVSKWSFFSRFLYSLNAITAFSTVPLNIVSFVGLAFLLAAILMTILTFLQWLNGQAVEGFTTVIILLLITGSVLMVALGIIGQYIAKIYHEIKRRPYFLIEDDVGL